MSNSSFVGQEIIINIHVNIILADVLAVAPCITKSWSTRMFLIQSIKYVLVFTHGKFQQLSVSNNTV